MSSRATAPKGRARAVTITWGVVILVIAGLLLVGQFMTLSIDPVIVALGLLVGVGLALVTGGLLSLRTRSDDDGHRAEALGTAGDARGGDSTDYGGDYSSDYGSRQGGVDKGREPTGY